jgi:RNA polymerase sigma-70 factor (ECF subfamily)
VSQAAVVSDQRALVAALRSGDEAAFVTVVRDYSPAMIRLAATIVGSRAIAEEVVQETWLAVLDSIDRFEARSTLKTWVFRILTNTAKTRAVRERRSAPFTMLLEDAVEPTVAPDRFLGPDARYAGHWASVPERWQDLPEQSLLASEVMDVVAHTIEALPPAQRAVISLRDVEGWDSHEVCEALGLTEGNQRVLLHRARARVRRALESQLAVW